MNASAMNLQLGLAHAALSGANMTNRLDLAKFALGIISGVAAAVVAEVDQPTVYAIACDGSTKATVSEVTDAAVALRRIAEQSFDAQSR